MCERGEKEIQNKNDMKKYQLYRPLLYQDRRSIDEFIKEDPMWAELCRLYLRMEKGHGTKKSALKTFNTVRFFCICATMDAFRENIFEEEYLQPLRETPGINADICCALAYVVLCSMEKSRLSSNYFLHNIDMRLRSGSPFSEKCFLEANDFLIEKHREEEEYWQADLCPRPVNPANLPSDTVWWEKATNFFTLDDLYVMLNFWPRPDDKLAVLDRMQEAGAMKADCLEIHTRLMELKKTNAVHPFGENLTLFASDILNIWNECQRVWKYYSLLQAPETTSNPLPDEEKAQQEKTLAATALEVKRLLKENQALAVAKEQLESQNKALQSELEALRTKNSKPAADAPSNLKELVGLVDKALELGDEKSLEKLLLWLTTMEGAERAKAQAKRVEQRLKALKAPVPHTQHNYYAGANHISGSELKGVSIGTTPANRTLTQE